MTSSTPTPVAHPFERKVDAVKASKSDINNLIMDYLITEGYPSAARKFAIEANIHPHTDFESINERVEIRDSIHKGDLQTAIEKINELNPQLLDTDASLHFSLLRLQLIELIRSCNSSAATNPQKSNSTSVSTALEFATTHLAPRAPTNPAFLADLERTMALLIFPAENLSPQLAELVDPQLRKVVANRVNEAILHSQGARREAQIRKLVRLRAWSEKIAREGAGGRKIELPDRLELGLDELDPSTLGGRQEHNGMNRSNGNGDTAMTGNGEAEGITAW